MNAISPGDFVAGLGGITLALTQPHDASLLQ
jgi:hypothetical protein